MLRIRLLLKLAAQTPNIMRGLKVAIVVGVLLNLINQWEALSTASWGAIHWPKFLLTFCVPFCVSVYSSAMAKL